MRPSGETTAMPTAAFPKTPWNRSWLSSNAACIRSSAGRLPLPTSALERTCPAITLMKPPTSKENEQVHRLRRLIERKLPQRRDEQGRAHEHGQGCRQHSRPQPAQCGSDHDRRVEQHQRNTMAEDAGQRPAGQRRQRHARRGHAITLPRRTQHRYFIRVSAPCHCCNEALGEGSATG